MGVIDGTWTSFVIGGGQELVLCHDSPGDVSTATPRPTHVTTRRRGQTWLYGARSERPLCRLRRHQWAGLEVHMPLIVLIFYAASGGGLVLGCGRQHRHGAEHTLPRYP